eukprot:TRINITY_DN642_c1_g1_i2.p1 TRINITY_DN642_c1_g1~~TRINITY_DN642_c1_g1_i2.p1  ORF type:complete len:792 (-),score=199.26 TRINITY_DN642_c1_g1_i2:28-2307(-)
MPTVGGMLQPSMSTPSMNYGGYPQQPQQPAGYDAGCYGQYQQQQQQQQQQQPYGMYPQQAGTYPQQAYCQPQTAGYVQQQACYTPPPQQQQAEYAQYAAAQYGQPSAVGYTPGTQSPIPCGMPTVPQPMPPQPMPQQQPMPLQPTPQQMSTVPTTTPSSKGWNVLRGSGKVNAVIGARTAASTLSGTNYTADKVLDSLQMPSVQGLAADTITTPRTYQKGRVSELFVDAIGFDSPSEPFRLEHLSRMKAGVAVLAPKTEKKLALSENEKFLQCGATTLVPLMMVDELRKGQKTTVFQGKDVRDEQTEKQSFSLVYDSDGSTNTLDIICKTVADFDLWVNGLVYVISRRREEASDLDHYKNEWEKLHMAEINYKTLRLMLKKLNFKMSKDVLKKKLEEFDENGNGKLNCGECMRLLQSLRSHIEIKHLFEQYSSDGGKTMSYADASKFFTEKQNENISASEFSSIVEAFDAEHLGTNQQALTLQGFERMLTSPSNEVIDPTKNTTVYNCMDFPMSYYWIASSHNTYLEGDQLTGKATLESYIRCFKMGGKCVEIDIWDGPDGEPRVTHGHTLTSTLKFYDVVRTIRDYAFIRNKNPVILSLENHCSHVQQEKMTNYFKSLLGDMIATPTHLNSNLVKSLDRLLSPNELAGKILIKGNVVEQGDTTGKVTQSLSNLTYLKSGGSADDLVSANDSMAAYEMISVSEDSLSKLNQSDLTAFNRRHFTRTYPKGTRFDSSNYDPMPGWNGGAQLVALVPNKQNK